MTEQQQEPGPGDGQGDGGGEASRISTLEAIQQRIAELAEKVDRALSGGGGGGGGQQGSREPSRAAGGQQAVADDRRREIREELASLRQQEAAEKERSDVQSRLGKIERKFEQAPRELRRVEKIMGWHGRP
jgi:hypothetical protein